MRLTSCKYSNLVDTFGRYHTYLRISLTERCNLRCVYCMPEEGISLTPKKHLLSTAEMLKITRLFVDQGVTKVRLTGGEPTVHRDLRYIIECLRDLKRLKTIGMTTNGLTLVRQLADLNKAGLNAINISLDTLNADKFEKISRRRGWSRVMAGIDHALELGYNPVKINCVIVRDFNDDEVLDFVELTRDKNIHVRFIEYMPFGGNKWNSQKMVTYMELVEKIRHKYADFHILEAAFNETSKPYKVPGFAGEVGFISSISNNFCGSCNRLRLLADGSLKVCLLGSAEISLRDALRNGCSDDDILALINAAVRRKKKQHAVHGVDSSHSIVTLINQPHLLSRSLPQYVKIALRTYSTTSNNDKLTHVTSTGKATMVDVSDKSWSARFASAYGEVHVGERILGLIKDNQLQKGDVLTVAKVAGVMAAKRTSEVIPLCHNIPLSFINISLMLDEDNKCVKITSEVRCRGETGVEMEALVAVSVAALTVYDMCKAVSHDIIIGNIQLVEKTGGKRDFRR